jgi:hypothetical protein
VINRQGIEIEMTESKIEDHIEKMCDDYDGDDVDLLVCIIYAMQGRIGELEKDRQQIAAFIEVQTKVIEAAQEFKKIHIAQEMPYISIALKMNDLFESLAEFDKQNKGRETINAEPRDNQ